MNSQQYLSQEPVHSQDITVQMGEKVHTELHQSQHVKYAQRRYHPMIKANNHFIAEDERTNEREPLDQAGREHVEPQRSQTKINVNNHFIAEDGRRDERGPMEQMRADPISFEPQRFQPMIKANNRFIVKDGRNYGRSPRHAKNGSVLFEQQNSNQ